MQRASSDEPVVLAVDDQRSYRHSLRWALRRECNLAVEEAGDFFHAIEAIRSNPLITVVVADWDLGPGPDGMKVLDTVKAKWPRVGRILLTGFMDADLYALARRAGHEAFDKSEHWATIVEAVCAAARRCAACGKAFDLCLCQIPG
jgi:DNA-binding NtrC family response regulator